MRLFLQYLRGKAGKIVAFFLFAVIFIVSFALYHLPLAAVWYPSVLCVILGLAVLLLDFRRVKARHETLRLILCQLPTLPETLPAAHTVPEEDYRALVQALCAQQQALDSTRRKIDAQRARYERDQRNAKARLQRMSAREKAVLREKERQEEQLDTAIAELQKLTKGNKAGASFSTRTSNLNLPVEGGRVKRYRDNMAEITGPKGARITAIYEGKVVDVKRNRITNRFDVYIAHGQYITSYANLNSVSVAKGQTVAKNSAIGVIGPAVDIQTMKTEYRLVFGIYPPAGAKKMRASDCFRK